jgi:hypothetical protein
MRSIRLSGRQARKPSVIITATMAACLASATFGCRGPSRANIELRKQNAELRGQVEQLQHSLDTARADLAALEARSTTVPSLPQARLDELFTTHGLLIGRLTHGADLDPKSPGDEGVRLYVVPLDDGGDLLKAAGSFVVRLIDPAAAPDELLVGEWEFSPAQANATWVSHLTTYCYVLPCPWPKAPKNKDLIVRVTFIDSLTGRSYSAEQNVTVSLPPKSVEISAQ